jgi:hypothetical protein
MFQRHCINFNLYVAHNNNNNNDINNTNIEVWVLRYFTIICLLKIKKTIEHANWYLDRELGLEPPNIKHD